MSLKILVVEDNSDIAANIADYLEPKGYILDFAADGALGLKLASELRFDVIVLDLMLPKMDGMSVCQRLREEHQLDTPIIMLTAKDQLDDKLQGFSAGADDYLVKPFSVKELEARIIAISKRGSNRVTSRSLAVADLEFNLATMAVTRAGQPLELNPSQRKLLQYLMEHRDRVVTRAELEELLWGDGIPDKDILRTHIYALRTQIDKPFDKKLIHTVHGTGYRIFDE